MSSDFLFTSESVSEGHPDKVADQISDAVLDAILAQDKRARVACETLVKTGAAIVAGEVTTTAWVDIEALARKEEMIGRMARFTVTPGAIPPEASWPAWDPDTRAAWLDGVRMTGVEAPDLEIHGGSLIAGRSQTA